MFEDFDKSSATREAGRGRMGVSLLISALLFAGMMAALAAAVATARVVVRRRQADVAVTFADLTRKAPPPKLVQKPRNTARKAATRAATVAPREIPEERPEEAEGELAEAGSVGPVDGFIDGGHIAEKAPPPLPPVKPAPVLPPSEQRRETIERPRFVSGCRTPDVPEALQSLAATIEIDVRMLVGTDGTVRSATITKSHPLIPDELILRCVREQVFEPAHLPDGTAVLFPFHRRFVFRPSSA